MVGKALIQFIERQTVLDRTSDVLQAWVRAMFRSGGATGRNLKDVLNGTWLGHPLHPALTDVPIGSWTIAIGLDAFGVTTGRNELQQAADFAVGVGTIGALGAAVAGLTDWSDTDSRPRRMGLAHAIVNIGATSLFAASFAMRRTDRRLGVILGFIGYGVASMGAFLGGHLVFAQRIGVTHAGQKLTDEFIAVLPDTELKEDQLCRAEVNTVPLVLVRHAGAIYALVETCAHLGGPLSQGTLEDGNVRCPWHNSCFSLKDGHVINGPAAFEQPCFETRVRDGQIEVRGKQSFE